MTSENLFPSKNFQKIQRPYFDIKLLCFSFLVVVPLLLFFKSVSVFFLLFHNDVLCLLSFQSTYSGLFCILKLFMFFRHCELWTIQCFSQPALFFFSLLFFSSSLCLPKNFSYYNIITDMKTKSKAKKVIWMTRTKKKNLEKEKCSCHIINSDPFPKWWRENFWWKNFRYSRHFFKMKLHCWGINNLIHTNYIHNEQWKLFGHPNWTLMFVFHIPSNFSLDGQPMPIKNSDQNENVENIA